MTGAGASPSRVVLAYSNLNERRPSLLTLGLQRAVPGVGRVAGQVAPYAAEWRSRNAEALRRTGPLWVVLGDSMSQGIGATSVANGWVLRAASRLREAQVDYRIVNLSFSGARVQDVIDRQLVVMARLGARPALITVLIGSNDLLRGRFRRMLPERFAHMLSLLPAGTLVATTPEAGGGLAQLVPLVNDAAAARGLVPVPLLFTVRTRAPDHFHPDDDGYAEMADAFFDVILSSGNGPRRP